MSPIARPRRRAALELNGEELLALDVALRDALLTEQDGAEPGKPVHAPHMAKLERILAKVADGMRYVGLVPQ